MDSEMFAEFPPFDTDELRYVAANLSDEAVKPEDVLQETHADQPLTTRTLLQLIIESPRRNTISSYQGAGTLGVYSFWKTAQDLNTVNAPVQTTFIFLAVPESIVGIREAWRCVLCTLISEISSHITHVPPEKMREYGIWGGQCSQKYLLFDVPSEDEGGTTDEEGNSIDALIDLLLALQHCDYQFYSVPEEGSSRLLPIQHSFVVVADRLGRFSSGDGKGYRDCFDQAMEATVLDKMGGKIFYIEEED
ncbi:hypothetical protein F5B22DRAFT_644226 [Xylaria bambusicola]|uniref:uncharacterized protein n=1 Tax=Xylaria bambusicola TaxID=326684 RepID=UPI002008AC08|nr:uncharacterized protein F5B22DRAFT_644226 [Xylaria bambusicola]KAI0520983.1 hypothetical protein F5B22DRAFT_644226 [Xylaria bambusicola]